MADFVGHEECPDCGSKDNLARYDDGSAYCFGSGCGRYEHADGKTVEKRALTGQLLPGRAEDIPARALTEAACRKYRYMRGTDRGHAVHLATYCDAAGVPVAQKVRRRDKTMFWVGDPSRAGLYGQHLWSPDNSQRVVITEGEIDAVSVAQVLGLRWPVVSVPNGASAAKRDLAKHLEWLERFPEIVLMFDQDDAGRSAAIECAELFTPGKARIAQLPRKDPNEMLVAGDEKAIVSAVYEANQYRPDGIVAGDKLWHEVSRSPETGLLYPWKGLDQYLYGQRPREVVTWCGGTGGGKSQLLREVAYNLAIKHQENVGIIALEESVRHAARAQMSLYTEKQLHLPPVWEEVSLEEKKEAFDATLGTGRYWFYDHFGSIDASSMIPKIRYLVVGCGCKWIILDHISIMVSGMATEGDERKRIDELMTKLRSLVEELEFGLHIVSHLRKSTGQPHEEGGKISLIDLRGSGAIGQISNIIVAAERDQQNPNTEERNTTTLRVLKNRFSGETGISCYLRWDSDTGRMVETAAPPTEGGEGSPF